MDQMLDYLQGVNAHDLFRRAFALVNFPIGTGRKEMDLLWVPVVEPENTTNPFLSRSPSDILNDNFHSDIDTMFGLATGVS